MVVHYAFPIPPPALARSKVSHRLHLTSREKFKLHLILSVFCVICFAGIPLLFNVTSSDPFLRDEYHSRNASFGKSIPIRSSSSLWASYSPYHPAGKYEASVRKGCVVTQVNILQRHGARYPTSGLTKGILRALHKLQAATEYHDPKLRFLKKYTYDLGVDDLVKFGADQSYALGEGTFKRYRTLLEESGDVPFVRAAGSKRVVLSAHNWTSGFSAADKRNRGVEVNLVIPETGNNTLANKMCPAAKRPRHETNKFLRTIAVSIAARLNSVAPGANLDPQDVYAIMHLCPFETVAKEIPSPFCSIFSKQDFEVYEYAGDLDKFYHIGYGGPLGAVQGVGYINELIGRLTNSPPHHGPQTNKTLLSSPETFPLNRAMYVDFSHDILMVAVFTAMGLFNQTNGPLDTTRITPDRTWIISNMAPFSGHMTVERLSCEGVDYDNHKAKGDYVRIFVDDALQPLEFCGANEDGMCRMDDFVTSQEYAQNDGFGDFERCEYTRN